MFASRFRLLHAVFDAFYAVLFGIIAGGLASFRSVPEAVVITLFAGFFYGYMVTTEG